MSSHAAESVAIVGTGAVGTALAHALVHAGVTLNAVASRHPERAKALVSGVGKGSAVSLSEVGMAASIVLVAVSDSAIETVAGQLGPAGGTLLAHTSGSKPAAALDAARERGAMIGGFHPLAAFVSADRLREAVDRDSWSAWFSGAAFAIEGDAATTKRLSALALALGGHPFAIAAADKPLYHLGASMLAAFSAGLAQLSWDAIRATGASPDIASRGAGHLLETVARNVARSRSPAEILTGPVARGDASGVARQAAAAEALTPEAQALYRVHVAHNIELALKAGRIDEETASALRAKTTTNAHGTAQRS